MSNESFVENLKIITREKKEVKRSNLHEWKRELQHEEMVVMEDKMWKEGQVPHSGFHP